MKKNAMLLTVTGLLIILGADLSCMKLLNKIAGDDPCTQAFIQRRKLANTHDAFEKSQLVQEIEVFDRLCRERNTGAPRFGNKR